MKSSKQCPKCKSLKIGYLETREVLGAASNPPPRGLTELFAGRPKWEPVGELDIFVCTECGYRESYVRAPEAVPWDRIGGFHWINAEAQVEGPYR